MRAALGGGAWQTHARTTGEVVDTLQAPRISGTRSPRRRGRCADPGVQYDSTINRWHTCPNTGRINASNPCSEYMFLDDTACNLASPEPDQVPRRDGVVRRRGRTATPSASSSSRRRSWSTSSAYPTAAASRKNSHDYRPLGLGYANLGTLLMLPGIAVRLRRRAARSPAALTAILCGHAYTVSARDGGAEGPVRRLRQEPRADAARDAHAPRRGLRHRSRQVPGAALARAPSQTGTTRVRLGQQHGYRNAQATVLAPTGTIGLLDGLRHDRHRARLRAGQVQEARRRRVLQDRQPVGARGAAPPRLLAGRGAGDRGLRVAARTRCSRRPARQPRRRSRLRGLTDDDLAKIEGALLGVVRSRPRLRPVDLGRRDVRAPRRSRRPRDASRLLAAHVPRLLRAPRSTRPTTSSSAA